MKKQFKRKNLAWTEIKLFTQQKMKILEDLYYRLLYVKDEVALS